MNRHRELAQMMRAAEVGGLGQNISRIQFTEGTGYLLADTGDAGIGANGAVFTTGASWTTESGKDVLVTADNDEYFPGGWHQGNSLDGYFTGPDELWSACIHVCVTRLPQYAIGMLMSKYKRPSHCGAGLNFYVAFEGDMKLRFAYYSGDTVPTYRSVVTDAPLIAVNEWAKIVVTYDGTQDGNNGLDRVKIYLNGSPVATSVLYQNGTFPFDTDPNQLLLTRLSYGNALSENSCRDYGLESKWADVTFFDRVLTPAQASLYAGGF